MYTIDDFGFTKDQWIISNDLITTKDQRVILQSYKMTHFTDEQGQGLVCEQQVANLKLISNAPVMLLALLEQQQRLEMLINLTPTGELRNQLCDENIAMMQLLSDIKG